jgi:hypothetical protein
MQGVTTALVGFLLLALIFPNVIKHRSQYYVALVCVCLIIALDALAGPPRAEPSGFQGFLHFVTATLQLAALICSVMSAGGLTARELATEVAGAYEVIRRGEDEKEVIIPIPEEIRRKAQERAATGANIARPDDEPQVFTIDSKEGENVDLRKPTPPPQDHSSTIPLE